MSTSRRNAPIFPLLAGLLLFAFASVGRAAEVSKFLPNGTEGLLTINVKQFLEAPLIKDKLDTLKLLFQGYGGPVQKALEEIGLDPFADLERVAVAVPNGQQPENSVLLVHGKFDVEKATARAEKLAKEHKDLFAATKEGAYSFWELTPPGKDAKVYLALLDDKLLVASGNRSSIVEALEKKAGKRNLEINRDFAQLLAKANLDATVSFVGMPGQLANAGAGGELFGRLQNVVAGVTLTEEVKIDVILNARNQDEAKVVIQMVKGAINQVKTLLQVQASKNPDFKPAVEVVDGFQVEQTGNAITVRGKIPKELLEKLSPQ
jgi:hypothetical protein